MEDVRLVNSIGVASYVSALPVSEEMNTLFFL